MSSIVKKVLRSSGKRKKFPLNLDSQQCAPQDPPSPDLSGLNPQEVAILKDVLKRQEEFESQETGRRQRLHDSLVKYEDEVKNHANQKVKLRTVDLCVCRLCLKTKFADGVGKACSECHKRVCNACGSFSKPSWSAKRQKNVKGKWRCVICEMKRDVVAMTGEWYHGNKGPEEPTTKFKSKLSTSEMDSSENDGRIRKSVISSPEKEVKESHESDVFSEVEIDSTASKFGKRPQRSLIRRRSSAALEVQCEIEEEIGAEEFQRERHMSRIRRQSKRSRRRLFSSSSVTNSATESMENESPLDISNSENSASDYPHSRDKPRSMSKDRVQEYAKKDLCSAKRVQSVLSLQEFGLNEESDRHRLQHRNSLCENLRKGHSSSNNWDDKRHSSYKRTSKHQHSQRLSPSQKGQSHMPAIRISKNVCDDKKILQKQTKRHIYGEDDLSNTSDSCVQMCDNNLNSPSDSSPMFESRTVRNSLKLKARTSLDIADRYPETRRSRESFTSCDSLESSPSGQLVSENLPKIEGQREWYHSSSSSVFSDNKQAWSEDLSRSELSVISPQRKSDTIQNDSEKKFAHRRSLNKGLTANRQSSNSLSPDMALLGSQKRDEKRSRFMHSTRSGSVSPRMVSGADGRYLNGQKIRDNYNRRMTLPYDMDIDYKKKNESGDNTICHARQVILHRNALDNSMRMRGLGMRLVGGKRRHDGNLGTYVTVVTKGGPADNQGITEGDEIVEWNGRSLANVTFEEALRIMNKESTDSVQLSVVNVPNKGSVSSLPRECPIIIRSAETVERNAAESRARRHNRRMLPKTPIEIKRDVRRICGRLWLKLEYNAACICLVVTLVRGEGIMTENSQEPNVAAKLHILPHRNLRETKESEVKDQTKDPQWNETFVFSNILPSDIETLSLEVTVWEYKESCDEFLGEVLLDLGEAELDDSVNCYHLEDHDENSSPLPYRHKSFSLSDSATSPASVGTSSHCPSREPSPRSSIHCMKDGQPRKLSSTNTHEKMSDLLVQGKMSRSRDRFDFSSSAHSSPLHSPSGLDSWRPDSSSRMEMLPPHPLNSSNNSLSFYDDDSLKGNSLDRPAPEGNDITSLLGPAQIPPRPSLEKGVCGDMKMGFMVSKGQLEIDIVVVKGLKKYGLQHPPDTYVKTYLMEGDKVVQKKKTQTIRLSFDPIFRKTIRYSACNIHGRCIRVNVWDKQKTFDKKQSLGEILVKLDNLDLSQHTMAWYKLFTVGAAEVGSDDNESLNFWPIT